MPTRVSEDGRDVLRLFDTLSGTVRPFTPLSDTVTLYVCGVTPYDTSHLGHAFTFAAFDVLIRYLRHQGLGVRYVQNVTDIDDPLFARARAVGRDYADIAREETEKFVADMASLNISPPDVMPLASQEIPDMIGLLSRLVERGQAYSVDGNTYFDVSTDRHYGELSKLSPDRMIELSGERGGDPEDPRKRHPLDFVLWRPSGADEPSFPAPWGSGLPGWHLECSAMSLKYLGDPVDIHGGGADLIFPHHESEIAQSEGATEVRPFSRFWMHTGMVYLGPEKMSKSLGNMIFVRDLLKTRSPNAVRLYLARHHYRSSLSYNDGDLAAAAAVADRLELAAQAGPQVGLSDDEEAAYRHRFNMCLANDLDSPGAAAVLEEMADCLLTRAGHERASANGGHMLSELGGVLGLTLS